MRTEVRFLLAIGLMIVVLGGTNLLFPPVPPADLGLPADSALVDALGPSDSTPVVGPSGAPTIPEVTPTAPAPAPAAAADPSEVQEPLAAPIAPEQFVTVEGPLYRFRFSSHGARLLSAELRAFESFTKPGPVQLIREGEVSTLGQRLLVAGDTIDLRRVPFVPSAESLDVTDAPGTLRFAYDHPTADFGVTLDFNFEPEEYAVVVSGTIRGVDAGVLFTDLGSGVALNETGVEDERRLSAYVLNHTGEGITAVPLSSVDEDRVEEGPLFWAVFKSKFFMFGALAGTDPEGEAYMGGLIATVNDPAQVSANVTVSQPFGPEGRFAYRVYAGPQDFQRLSAQGNDLEDANPYGWKFMRPLIQPFTGLIIGVLNWMHDRLNLAYGWVLMLFGVLMLLGWPALYLAKRTGCEAVLTDLPAVALRDASFRAQRRRVRHRCAIVLASGRALPFRPRSFDAVVHTDVL